VAGVVGVHVAEGAVDLAEGDLDGATGVGDVLRAEDDQRTVTGATLGVARQLDRDDLAVGRLDGFVSGEDVRAGTGAGTDDADRLVLGIDLHQRVDLGVNVRDDQADRVADRVASHELG
jgi:hypothetical protein